MKTDWACLNCMRSGEFSEFGKNAMDRAIVAHTEQLNTDKKNNAIMAARFSHFVGPNTECVPRIQVRKFGDSSPRLKPAPSGVLGGDEPWI